MFKRFIFEEDGQSLIEYGLLLSLLAIVLVAVLSLFGGGVRDMYERTSNQLPN